MDDAENMVEFAGIGEVAETTTQLLALSLHAAGYGNEFSSEQRTNHDPVQHLVLQQARDYLNKVREGFVLSVRSNQVRSRAEIGYLVDRALIDWEAFSRELGLEDEGDRAANTTDATARNAESADSVAGGSRKNHSAADRTPGSHPTTRNSSAKEPAPESMAGEKLPGELSGAESAALEKVRHQVMAFAMAAVALGFLPKLPSKAITFPHSYSSPPTYSDIPVPATAGEMLSRIEEMQSTLWQMMSNDMGHLIQRCYGPVRRTYGFFEVSAWLAKKDAERFGIKQNNRTAFSWF